jgi:flagellin
MRSLAVDSSNGAVNDADMFAANQAEFAEALGSITRISDNTQFGTKKLLDGSVSSATFQVGSDAGQEVSVTIADMDATALGVAGLLVSDASSASSAITTIDTAINTVSTTRGTLGALQADNLEVQYDSLRISYENLQAAESTIRDTDMTKEMAEFTKLQIMMQAGTAMLAQANQLPNNVLQLLR